jgi:tetratricopeptide (TPR) repeat protein
LALAKHGWISSCIRQMAHWRAAAIVWVLTAGWLCAWGAGADTNRLNRDPQVVDAYRHFYELDFPGAVDRFERVHAQHPGDPQATALLLNAEIFEELYRLDLLDTTFYANDGFLTGKHATQEDPKARDQIFALADEAMHEADSRISKNPNDVDALFARGWTRSLRCAYMAMVERAFGSGFRLATKARDDEQKVLQIDPNYVDAKLVVGVYEYVVGALPWPFKLLIGFAGITGSKSQGLAMLYDDGNRGVITSVEARTVIALFLRREGRYKEAIQVIRALKNQYPHDYLFCLEEANLRKDAGEGMGAVYAYRQILADNARPNYFTQARLELTYFGLGDALRGQRHEGEAAQAYEQAAMARNVGTELRIRSLLAAGECRDLNGERQRALADYQAAINAGPNTSRADTARKLLQSPYRGT